MHKFRSMEKEYVRPAFSNKTDLTKDVVDWFASRGISQNTLIKLRITQSTEWMPGVEKKVGVICFNYFRDGKLVNIKFRDRDKNFKLVKDAERIWYNHDAIKNPELIIVEGEMDALSFVEVGFDNVVSVPSGSSNYKFFELEALEAIKKFYIAVDNDASGVQLKMDLVRRIGSERCVWIDWGECKDANEFLVKKGKNQLREIISKAKEFPISGVVYAHDFAAEIENWWKYGPPVGKKIGHTKLDELISFETGRLMVVTGVPTHGKSEFVDEILTRLCVKHQWKCAFFTPENRPMPVHINKLVAKISGSYMDRLSIDALQRYVDFIDENFFWVLPDDEDFGLDVILEKAELLVKKYGINAFVIDPWNYVEHQFGTMTETQYVNATLSKIASFSKKCNVLMILIAHPVKMPKTNGMYEVPNLYSISGSSSFFSKSDYGLTVYRLANDDVQIHVQKVKFKHLGHSGMVEFRNNVNNGRYQEMIDGAAVKWNNEPFFQEKEVDNYYEPKQNESYEPVTTNVIPF